MLAALVDQVRDALGPIDVLVANAGLAKPAEWEQVDAADYDRTMAGNLRAPFLLAKAALPAMRQRGFGRVLFVSSTAAIDGGMYPRCDPAAPASVAGLGLQDAAGDLDQRELAVHRRPAHAGVGLVLGERELFHQAALGALDHLPVGELGLQVLDRVLAAATPSIFGILTSMTTRSGLRSRASWIACSPSPASPTTVWPPSSSVSTTSTRIRTSSSATSTRAISLLSPRPAQARQHLERRSRRSASRSRRFASSAVRAVTAC